MMRIDLIAVCALYGLGLAIFLVLFLSRPKKSKLNGDDGWLFHDFFHKMYFAFFGDKDPTRICKSLGMEYDKYMLNCLILNRQPDLVKEAMAHILGVFLFVASVPATVILYSPVPLVIGCVTYLLLCSVRVRSIAGEAERKKLTLLTEMPRFVDLLLSALEANMSVENAIIQTADAVPCVLSDELKATLAETKLGAKNWQQALEAVAHKYEIDELSDFVLNIITAYNKGISVTAAVTQEAHAIRQSALLKAKERTAKMTSTILFPLVIFKMIPLMALMMIPIMIQAMSFYS